MADNVTVANSPTSSLTDIPVRTTLEVSSSKHIQHFRVDPASSATISVVSGSASSATMLAANAYRKGVIVFNDSSAAMYIKFGATASSASFTYKIFPSGTWEMNQTCYDGIIDCIWDSATGDAKVTEL